MPAERTTRASKRATAGVQLTWTTPVDASTLSSIAFAPNVTPGTFNDPPSPVESATESALFPSTADSPLSNRRLAHSKKKPDNHIPRPPNAFILFRSSFIKNQHVSSEVETNHSTLSKIIGLTWQSLPHEERQIWHAKAKTALDEHKRKWPEYAFRPLHTKGKGAAEKRKVREVGPKDLKRCAKIAELLVEGKKGPELDAAIQEFDRHHVPEVVTRFETPITARTYRRSSSAPAPETEHTKPTFLITTPPNTSGKIRASSSQPETPSSPTFSGSYTPSMFGCDSDSKSEFYSSPPSPFVLPDTFDIPAINPSFNFNTFSFNSCAASQLDACDPLSTSYHQNTLDIFSPAPVHYSQPNASFDTSLSVDTSFMDNWTSGSSPLSSMPSTPESFSSASGHYHNALTVDQRDMAPLVDPFASQFEFFHSGGQAEYALPCSDMPFGAPPIGNSSKHDFALYDRSALNSLDNDFSPSFMASISTFAM